MSQYITIAGNLADEPDLRFTNGGKAVIEFTVITSRSRKLDDGSWESTDVTGWRVKAWERLAENCAESLHKGTAVIVTGPAAWRSWENKDGSKGGRLEITATEVGASLRNATAALTRSTSSQGRSEPQTASNPWDSSASGDDIPPF